MSQDRPVTHVVVHSAPGNTAMGTAGLIFSALGWVTCGLLCPLGALFSFLGLFGKGSKSHAVAGLIVGFPGVIFLAVFGFGFLATLVGGGAVVQQAREAAIRMQQENERKLAEQANTPPAAPADELPTDASTSSGSIPVEDATKPSETDSTSTDDATKPVIPATEPAKDETKPPEQPPTTPALPPVKTPIIRTWESATRKFSVEAEYISHDETEVTLKRVDNGVEVKVPIDKLCREDVFFLKQLAK